MVTKVSDFAAQDSYLGYIYQARYALYILLLTEDEDAEISIEKIDDIAFSKNGSAIEKLQLKHTEKLQPGSLSNSSSELWRTLRVWSTELLENKLNLQETILTLVACKKASKDTIAYKLKPYADEERDIPGAISLLNAVAHNSINKANKDAYEVFNRLSPEQKEELVGSIYVLDAQPNIVDIKQDILKLLRLTVKPQYREALYTRLEGWWMNQVVEHLSRNIQNGQVILKRDLYAELFELQGEYQNESLPIEFLDLVAPEEETFSADERVFIDQLRLIEVGNKTIQKAISDYYRAFTQRSKWIADGHLVIGDVKKYENRLVDEWERLFSVFEEDFTDATTETEKVKAGRDLYRLVQELKIHIRPRCTEPYVMRGTYQRLARYQDVGWHCHFKEKLSALRTTASEGIVR